MVSIGELDLPHAVVARVIKEALNDNGSIGKDAKLAVIRSTTVFISFLTWTANDVAKERSHKTITGDDVLKAIEICEFDQFLEPLREELRLFKAEQHAKKAAKRAEKASASAEAHGPPSSAQLAMPPANNDVIVEILPSTETDGQGNLSQFTNKLPLSPPSGDPQIVTIEG